MACQLAIFVDLDNTLLYTGSYRKTGNLGSQVKPMPAGFAVDDSVIFIRPDAARFARFLKLLTQNVFILTAGERRYQTEILRAAGLLGLFKGVYGAGDAIPQCEKAILVDNCPDCRSKYQFLRQWARKSYPITVKAFYGKPDRELKTAAMRVMRLAGA
jgi:FMN phosphatase YigB (HAD superfamily)